MPYPWSHRIEGLLVKEESTYGTDPTPSASVDGIRAEGRIWGSIGHEWAWPNMREDVVSNSLIGVAPAQARGRVANIDLTVQLMGAGAAYSSSTPVRPEVDALLRACAMSRTHVDTGGSEKVTYALADTGHVGVTVWAYAGGKLFKVNGCRGSFEWVIQAGTLGKIRFQLQGRLASVAESAVASITYDSVVPPAAVGMGLALVPSGGSSWTPRVKEITVIGGVEVDRLDDVDSADGIERFEVGGQHPRFTMSPRAVDLSDYPAYTLASVRTVHTIDFTLGSTQYNRVKLDVNTAYLENDPAQEDDGRFAAFGLGYMLRDLAIVFD